jgi:TetR/AcrR family transcriptional regulator, transcriptional repressor of bet genes
MAKPAQKPAGEGQVAASRAGRVGSVRGRRTERAPERRQQIVQAMLEVVAERGYEGASVAEVARRAGLAPGLVHYYFRDKLALGVALIDRLGEVAAEREAERLPRAPEGGRALSLVDAYLARGSGEAPAAVACWVALGAEAVRRPEMRQAYGRVLGEVAARLGALLCLDGVSTPAGARRDAAAIVAAIQGYFLLSVTAGALVPEGSAAEAVRAMVKGLRGGNEAVALTTAKGLRGGNEAGAPTTAKGLRGGDEAGAPTTAKGLRGGNEVGAPGARLR